MWFQAADSGSPDSPRSTARSLGQHFIFGFRSRRFLILILAVLLGCTVSRTFTFRSEWRAFKTVCHYRRFNLIRGAGVCSSRTQADSSVRLHYRAWLRHVIFILDIIGWLVPRLLWHGTAWEAHHNRRRWMGNDVACFKEPSRYSPGNSEENHERPHERR